ncbi:MAG: hypothetical protein QOG22_1793, partial [Pseudonocardiales bacterium]|nr:hypothetical protein [Pseudonocardiales bacterium]
GERSRPLVRSWVDVDQLHACSARDLVPPARRRDVGSGHRHDSAGADQFGQVVPGTVVGQGDEW